MAGKEMLGGALDLFGWTELPPDWQFDLLGNRCTIRRGASPRPAGDPRYFGGGTIPWIKIGDATRTAGRYIESTDEFVNQEGAKHSVHIPAGSLIIANSGVSLGFAAITRIDGCIHDGWLLTTEFRDLDRDYLYYCINLVTRKIRNFADGTTQPNLNTDIARRLLLPIPPLNEQRAIANVLSTLDDKIELNRRMNETLEAMARALFKSWFVDFDPVRAKAEGRDPGLPQPLADLFPDSFEESSLEKIPNGWQCSTVGKHFSLTMGQSPPGSTYNESGDGLPFFQGRTDFGFRFPSRRVFCTGPTRLAQAGDTLVSVRAPVGDVNIAIEPCAVGRGVAAVRHLSGSRSLTYHAMHNLGEHFGKFEGEGTVFGSINKADFERLPFVAPAQAVLDCFERIASPIDDRVESNEVESRTLTDLRDTLLPKLISGEVRIVDAERVIHDSPGRGGDE
jgi:type I restriction enzyme, S subunit